MHQGSILVVDDEQGILNLVQDVLKSNGYVLISASDGNAAMSRAHDHAGPIHLLFTDVVMPGMNGHDLAKRLLNERSDVKVLYMSGHVDDTVLHHGVSTSEASFLPKPFTPQLLLQKVRDVLDARRLH